MTDETNLEPSKVSRFFMYGGLILPVERLSNLHTAIADLRSRYGFGPGDSLKFSPRDKPKHMSREAHANAKDELLTICHAHEVRFVVLCVLHDIAKNRDRRE